MKLTKLVLGIVSVVLFVVIMFQSCAVGVGNALNNNTADMSGTGGMLLAFSVLIAGIVAIATGKSRAGGFVAGAFYLAAALLGFASMGTFTDLVIWSWMSLIFGIVFVLGSLTMKKPKAE